MDMTAITDAAGAVLTDIALAVLTLLAAYAVYYIQMGTAKLKAQTARLEDEAGREVLENALDDVERLAILAVNSMEQTAAKAIRAEVKAGKTDREKLLALGREVFEEVKGETAPEAQQVIMENLGSFDRYLEQCIESAVLQVKQEDPCPTVPEGLPEEAAPDGVPSA